VLTVTLYSRKNCSLCDQARADLESLRAEFPHRLVEIDIESDPVLHQKYLAEIPVVEVGPYRLRAPIEKQQLAMTLGAARDRKSQLEKISGSDYQRRVEQAQVISGADRFSMWMAKNYLWAVLLIFAAYVGLPMLAPVLMKTGATLPARIIYTAYSPLCHELGFRSFFLFGPQYYYPRASAGVEGVMTFGEATGLDENDLWAARAYVGNEQVGYKMALCQRDITIYLSIVAFIALFGLTGRRIKPLNWIVWLLVGIGPIGLDGFSQLFSQVGIPFLAELIPYRESTPFLRVLTGSLFGFTTAWFGLPYVEESMRETRELLIKKFKTLEKA
jgi:uncharacterized membrane protein